ncbi:hypothetical protein BDY21DRAFT_354858 [Lineolata rhizophorae]|uniref:Uncharacterized protein n=1 Tax=Lineolata rhizophorae TaxID=578093 RepID=A0A6A6NPK9_9PEZI|nr:hypothetical protein BDY21DRAFT_354858 [Lineolata rhizophorae]
MEKGQGKKMTVLAATRYADRGEIEAQRHDDELAGRGTATQGADTLPVRTGGSAYDEKSPVSSSSRLEALQGESSGGAKEKSAERRRGSKGKGKKVERGVRVAMLVRTDETRTPGTGKTTAGNGGELVVDEYMGCLVEEPLLVASCILMLKKEIDRRRLLQAMVIAGGAGG